MLLAHWYVFSCELHMNVLKERILFIFMFLMCRSDIRQLFNVQVKNIIEIAKNLDFKEECFYPCSAT